MDKIAGLREILVLDPRNSLARYGLAMEFANRGETGTAIAEFSQLLSDDPEYTAAYFMLARALASAGRKPEAIEQLKAGMSCAERKGNNHAFSEMQAMFEDLQRERLR